MKFTKVLIEIPTKNRDAILGRCLASLVNQSYQDFDVLILNDGDEEVGRVKTTQFFLEQLKTQHWVWVEDGSRISQAHNHNIPLYDPRFRGYQYICRLDDDVLMNYRALEYMVEDVLEYGVDCVGGLWFEREYANEQFFDRRVPDWGLRDHYATIGVVGEINNNWQQRVYHPTDDLYDVQHVYSVALYNADAMRRAGGWPEVYSKGVAHGEETDGTYRLFLSGCRLSVDPRVSGQHLKSPGGIRSTPKASDKQYQDGEKWKARKPLLEKINFRQPKIALWCQHEFGIGGAQRLYYETVSLLQSSLWTQAEVHPILGGDHISPQQCQEIFGFTYQEYPPMADYDVCIVMAHEPFYPVRAKHYILYTFFPDEYHDKSIDATDVVLGISQYTAEWIGKKWLQEAGCIYPVANVKQETPTEKLKWILCVGRADPHKAPLWLMEHFAEWQSTGEFEGWELHVVLATTEVYATYEKQIKDFAAEHPSIVLHINISEQELQYMYRKSAMLWAANGLYAENDPKVAEHFGLTPIEAWSKKCVPIVYDIGGHRETVDAKYRWKDADDLLQISKRVVEQFGKSYPDNMVDIMRFGAGVYVREWTDLIYRVNAYALEKQPMQPIDVKPPKIRLAMICDSPRLDEYEIGLTTGFAIVGGQIVREIVKQPDFDLYVFGLMDTKIPHNIGELPYHFYPSPRGDMQAYDKRTLPDFIQWADADVIFEIYDPGNMLGHVNIMNILGESAPIVGYFPMEGGSRISHATYELVQKLAYPVTYCNAGKELIHRILPDVPVYVAYHGADHADFKPLAPERRQKFRELVGWDGKFVLMNCGTNKRVKQQPILIEAMRLLLQQGHDDIYLYLHTRPFDDHIMQGWTLDWIIEHDEKVYGVPLSEHVLFPPILDKWRGIPYTMDNIEEWRMTTPPEPRQRGALFAGLDFITRYGIADMYVDVSSAEGHGLPVLEAAACGVPCISINDGMARTEIHSRYCHMLDPDYTYDTWHISSTLSLVNPQKVADTILMLKGNAELRNRYAPAQARIREDLPWKRTADFFIDLFRRAYATKTRR